MRRVLYIIIGVLTLVAVGCADGDVFDLDRQPGPPSDGPFRWTRAEDVETRKAFLRNFGVGYSYNAVRGAYCDWRDIRCQVINRLELDRQGGLGQVMWYSHEVDNYTSCQKLNYSQRDYVQSMDLKTERGVDFGLYTETSRTRQYVLEEGIEDEFYYSTEERVEKGEQYIQPQAIMHQVVEEENENLLTQSFRDAVEHLAYADADDYAVVDSFLSVWGTHVITRAFLGGSLRLDLKNHLWRYTDYVQEEAFTARQVMDFYNSRKEDRHDDERYTWIEHSSLNVSVRGGDQSLLGHLIGEASYDGTRQFNIADVEKWRLSVQFNPDDEQGSNVEMISMDVVPIWDFIVYPHVQRRVKAAVLQDAALQQELLGDRNYFNTSFPVTYPKATARYQQSTGQWATVTRTDTSAEPMVVNIVSGGRYVATVCHEQLGGLDLWVCYPVYEGRVKLACGLGVGAGGEVCRVRWLGGDEPQVERLPALEGTGDATRFYITGGEVGLTAVEAVSYADAKAVPYMEVVGGVQPDGGYAIPAVCPVLKQKGGFAFWLPQGAATAFAGWDATATEADGRRLYSRNSHYIYIYNPNELTYE